MQKEKDLNRFFMDETSSHNASYFYVKCFQ